MITTVFQVCMLRLWHNKAEWVLTFVVPVIFFSIFAMIFAGRGTSGGTARLKIAIVDDVRSAESMQAVEQLKKLEAFRLYPDSVDIDSKENSPTRQEAASWVRKGIINVAIVFKAGEEPDRMNDESVSNSTVEPLRENIDPNNRTNKTFAVELLSDSYDQVANQVVVRDGATHSRCSPHAVDPTECSADSIASGDPINDRTRSVRILRNSPPSTRRSFTRNS